MRITVPASSANLGPGFDALGLALSLPFDVSVGAADDAMLPADERHPLTVAYRAAGGTRPLWWRSPIPPGRGLGFSGAARVAGAFGGFLDAGLDEAEARSRALALAGELEHHPDNAGASMLGGLVVSAGGRSVRVPLGLDVKVVAWWPPTETSTERSRAALPETVSFDDAVFNIGRSSLLVAALASGDLAAIAVGVGDRLHTDRRLARLPESADALERLRRSGSIASWLSGSGPTVAALVHPGDADRVSSVLPAGGITRVLDVDGAGARIVDRDAGA